MAFAFSVVAACGLASAAAFGQQYRATPLGTLGGSGSIVADVNDQRQAAGTADLPDGSLRAFFWEGGAMTDLGTLPGGAASQAFGLNNLGQVAGMSEDASGADRAVVWTRNASGTWEIADLGTLGGPWAFANDINDAGQVTGQSSRVSGGGHAFLYTGGGMLDLGALDYPATIGISEGTALNGAGHVVGYAYAPLWGPEHGFHYDGVGSSDITNPGQFGMAHPTAINDAGVIVGWFDNFEAGIYTGGAWVGLGMLPDHDASFANDLNEAGQVVGYSAAYASQDFRGVLHTGGQMLDLNQVTVDAPGQITEAIAVSEAGVIAANAAGATGPVALLLLPACAADMDGDGTLTLADFVSFRNLYVAGDLAADFDGSGTLTLSDFVSFRNAYTAGCD